MTLKKQLQFALALSASLLASSGYAQQVSPASQAESPLSVKLQASEQIIQTVSSLADEMMGYIDWDNNMVYAVGDGVPPTNAISPAQARVRAKRAAIDEAYARLLETVKAVRVDAESTTRDFINENRVVQTRVSGLIKHAEVVELRQAEDGSYQVKLRMPMNGPKGINAALLPVQMHKVTRIVMAKKNPNVASEVPSEPISVPESKPTPEWDKDAPQASTTGSEAQAETGAATYSSLIVDARSLNASPAMFPRILAHSGEVLYDLTKVDPNAAVNGMCIYKKSLEAANRQLSQGDGEPLLVKAVDTAGKNHVDLILNDKDAESVMSANEKSKFLWNGLVMVIID